MKKRGPGIRLPQCLPVFMRPIHGIVDANIRYGKVAEPASGLHWNGQPCRAGARLDAVSVDEAVLLELYMVQDYVDVAGSDAFKIAEPRQIGGLHDGYDHASIPPDRGKISLNLHFPKISCKMK